MRSRLISRPTTRPTKSRRGTPAKQVGAWQSLAFEGADDIRTFAAQARRDLQISEFLHDLEWLNAERGDGVPEIRAWALRSRGGIEGLLCARVATQPLVYSIGERVILQKPVRQFTIHQGPRVPSVARNIVMEGFRALARGMEDQAIAYISAVPVGSPTHAVLSQREGSIRDDFWVLPWGHENPHFKIRWDGTLDAYFASLSPKRRANVRRAQRRLKSSVPYQLRRFRSVNEVANFWRDAASISMKTYQGRELGLGLADHVERAALIRFAAERDAFLGYVLYIRDAAVAYRFGVVHADTLFALSTAYDPAYASHRPGDVIFLEMLQDLETLKLPINQIDLLPHNNVFKRERANLEISTSNYFLFPRTHSGLRLFLPLKGLESGQLAAKAALGWWHQRKPK